MYDSNGSDKLSYFSLKLGRPIAFFLIIAFFAAIVFGVFKLFEAVPEQFQEPVYEDYQAYLERTGRDSRDLDFSNIDMQMSIMNKYDEHIRRVIVLGEFDESFYHTLVAWLADMPHYRRSRFINGLESFLEDYQDTFEEEELGAMPDMERHRLYAEMTTAYKKLFAEKLDKERAAREKASNHVVVVLLLIGMALLLFMVALAIPILLKIEKNSRLFQ